jgi:hypothetical protein
MPLPLYPRGKSPRYPLDRRLGGPQSRYGSNEEEINTAPMAYFNIILTSMPPEWFLYFRCVV